MLRPFGCRNKKERYLPSILALLRSRFGLHHRKCLVFEKIKMATLIPSCMWRNESSSLLGSSHRGRQRQVKVLLKNLAIFISTAKWPQHFINFFYTDSNKELYTLKYRVTKVCREQIRQDGYFFPVQKANSRRR